MNCYCQQMYNLYNEAALTILGRFYVKGADPRFGGLVALAVALVAVGTLVLVQDVPPGL